MLDWLFEGQSTVYVILAALVIGLLFVYWQQRRKLWLYASAGVVALIALYFLLDLCVETDREQIQHRLELMAAAVRAHNEAGIFEHVSDHYQNPPSTDKEQPSSDKEQLRQQARRALPQIDKLILWDFRFEGRPERTKDYEGMRFQVKVGGPNLGGEPWFDCHPIFDYDPATGWRLKSFKLYKPGTTEEFRLDGIP